MKLKASTTVKIARPGNVPTHQSLKFCVPSATIAPHSAVGGWAPRPRNDRPDSSRTAFPMSSVASTSTGPGSVRQDIDEQTRAAGRPSSRDAITYCAELADSTRPRTSRA